MRIIKKDGEAFENSIYLSFKYDPVIVEKVKRFGKRSYHPDTKEWELPANLEEQVREIFKEELNIFEVGEPVELPPIHIDMNLGELPADYVTKVKPYEHQITAMKYAQTHDKFLLGDDMGLGKTGVAITIAANRPIKHCLVVCGVNSIKWNWKREIETFSYKESRFLGQKTSKKTGKITIGTAKDKINDLDNFQDIKEFFIITNVETLQNETIVSKLEQLCRKQEIGMIIVDEAHKCCSADSKQTQGLLKLRPKYRLAMTGTPLMNNPLDLYAILSWLDVEKRNFWSFKSYYCVLEEKTAENPKTHKTIRYKKITGYKNLAELQERLANVMIRRLKTDTIDLPEKTFIDEVVEMEKDQEKLYNDWLEELLPEIIKEKNLKNALTKMLRLRQITSAAETVDEKCSCAKLDRMEELVTQATSNNNSVVIFSNWTTVTDVIMKRLKDYSPALITGKVDVNRRNEEEKRFQSGETKVLIGTCAAMGTGLNFTKGNVVIFVDEPWTMAVKNQNTDRCHRIGQKNPVTVYTLITKDTVDEKVHQILETKGDLAKALVDTSCICEILEK